MEEQGEAKPDLIPDGRARPHGRAEVQPRGAPDPRHELAPDGLVEAEARALRLQRLGGDRAAVAGQPQLDHVAGNDPDEEEREDRHPEQGGEHQDEALEEIAPHTVSLGLPLLGGRPPPPPPPPPGGGGIRGGLPETPKQPPTRTPPAGCFLILWGG